MERQDKDLAFLLRYENVAWYEKGRVRILDRRVYPMQTRFVECETHEAVAQAIRDMVTQSSGPYTAAGMGMALAGWQARDLSRHEQISYLEQAAKTLANARPTTANRMAKVTGGCLEAMLAALERGDKADEAAFENTVESLNRRYSTFETVAGHLLDVLPQNATVMTQCFGETIIGMLLRVARKRGSQLRLFCPETRPYLQGARLTASVCSEMGFETTVITDNMAALTMQEKGVDAFTSAADSIAMDGYIANKIGTLQLAVLAAHFGIPYFVTGIPDRERPSGKSIPIEQRDAADVLSLGGTRHTLPNVQGFYPAFDITPPRLISGVVTDKGVFSPYDLPRYFEGETKRFY